MNAAVGRIAARAAASAAVLALGALLSGFGAVRPSPLGVNSLGMADAQVATGVGTTALYANPAGMAQVRLNTLDMGTTREAGRTSLHVTSVDNTSDWGLAAGVGYSYDTDWTQDAPVRSGHDFRAGVAFGFQSDSGRLLFGGTGGYTNFDSIHPGTAGTPVAGESGWSGDLGLAVGMSAARLGVVLRNAFQVDPVSTPRRIATGIGIVTGKFLAEAGGSWGSDANSGAIYRAGAAFQLGDEGVQLRAGWRWHEAGSASGSARGHAVTGGLSWRTTAFSLDGSVAVEDVGRESRVVGGVGLTFVLPYDVQ